MNIIISTGTDNEVIFKAPNGQIIAECKTPVILQAWDGIQHSEVVKIEASYNKIEKQPVYTVCEAIITNEAVGLIKITDRYMIGEKGEIELDRNLKVIKEGKMKGLRLFYEMDLNLDEDSTFAQLRYFAPPAIFDKNDLDEDGMEDYFHTQKLLYREDRFNYPMFMAYSEKNKLALRLERAKLPQYDSIPERKRDPLSGTLDSEFIQKTDIGSLGIWGEKDKQVKMKACYPFYEGDATIGLYIIKMVPFGAFWPLKEGEGFAVSYKISLDEHDDFHEACWDSIRRVIKDKKPQPAPLRDTPEALVKYRLEALNRYYVEKTKDEDQNEPAGYVLNCHPQKGEQLENIIQYGFTGQNIMNAYNVLRFGYEKGDKEYVRRAIKITDFFADVIHIKDSGMFYNLYNIDMKKVNFWWTGLLLPLAYAVGDELEGLMGPLYEYRKEVINTLSKLKGAYLRCMNEDVTSLLRIYLLEKGHGNNHENWIAAVENYCRFLLKSQERDGSWYRAYDLEGNPIIHPEIWFGATIYEKKSSTATSIPLLVEMYQYTKDIRYLEAARKAGRFVKEYIIDRVRFNGGIHDSIYSKGQLIDNESILYSMFGMLSLYEETKDPEFLEGAVKAAHFNAAWVCLWNVPLPEDSTLARHGFNSIGLGACDTCGAGYVHPFQLMCVAEICKISIYAKDKELFDAARLYWLGCNQTVELPQSNWGYAHYGLQEEGYLVSWWAVDDPMFSADTGFGHRLKGEGNKTCFPWINAVGVKAYWTLLDLYGTTDFDVIYDNNFK